MEHLVSFIKSIWESGKERLKNPFIGSFVLALLVWNWKGVLVILFSSKPVEENIQYALNQHVFMTSISEVWGYNIGWSAAFFNTLINLLIPFSFAMAYTLILPTLMIKIDKWNKKKNDVRKENLKNDRIDDLERLEGVAEAQNKVDVIKIKYKREKELIEEISEKDMALEKAKKDKEALKVQLESYEKDNKSLKSEVQENKLLRIQVEEKENKQKELIKESNKLSKRLKEYIEFEMDHLSPRMLDEKEERNLQTFEYYLNKYGFDNIFGILDSIYLQGKAHSLVNTNNPAYSELSMAHFIRHDDEKKLFLTPKGALFLQFCYQKQE